MNSGKRKSKRRRRRRDHVQSAATTMFHSAPAAMDLLKNRYRLEDEIGRGGMGVVYRAFDTELEMPVAIKLLPAELGGSPKALKDLKREAVLAMRLRHPGIMALYHFDDSDNRPFLVMELLEGVTLETLLAEEDEGTLEPDTVLELALPLAEAVDYAHSEGIVHRDIKPANIFICEKDGIRLPKIMDFGIARQIRDSMSRVSNIDSSGTLLYMSPEQLQGRPVDSRADIYSLAATLYECLAGHPPFFRGAISYQIVNNTPREIDGLPEHMNAALLKSLSKDPGMRHGSAVEMVKAMAAGGSPGEAVLQDTAELPVNGDDDGEPKSSEVPGKAESGEAATSPGTDGTADVHATEAPPEGGRTEGAGPPPVPPAPGAKQKDTRSSSIRSRDKGDSDIQGTDGTGKETTSDQGGTSGDRNADDTDTGVRTRPDPSSPEDDTGKRRNDGPGESPPSRSGTVGTDGLNEEEQTGCCLVRTCSILFYTLAVIIAFALVCLYLDEKGYFRTSRPPSTLSGSPSPSGRTGPYGRQFNAVNTIPARQGRTVTERPVKGTRSTGGWRRRRAPAIPRQPDGLRRRNDYPVGRHKDTVGLPPRRLRRRDSAGMGQSVANRGNQRVPDNPRSAAKVAERAFVADKLARQIRRAATQGQGNVAVNLLGKLISLAPEKAERLVDVPMRILRMGDDRNAVRALALLPGASRDPERWLELARATDILEFALRAKCYSKVLALDDTNVEALLGLARVCMFSDKHAKARRLVRRALEVDPGNEEARRIQADLDGMTYGRTPSQTGYRPPPRDDRPPGDSEGTGPPPPPPPPEPPADATGPDGGIFSPPTVSDKGELLVKLHVHRTKLFHVTKVLLYAYPLSPEGRPFVAGMNFLFARRTLRHYKTRLSLPFGRYRLVCSIACRNSALRLPYPNRNYSLDEIQVDAGTGVRRLEYTVDASRAGDLPEGDLGP